jgi:hypothetical protein
MQTAVFMFSTQMCIRFLLDWILNFVPLKTSDVNKRDSVSSNNDGNFHLEKWNNRVYGVWKVTSIKDGCLLGCSAV